MSDLGSFKPSIHLEELLSEELRDGSENFLQFLTAYYEWLQTTNITYESAIGSFTKDEIIIGTSTLAQATINQVDTTNNQLVVTMTTNKVFDNQEVFAQSIPEVRFNVEKNSNTIFYSSAYSNTVISNISIDDVIRINGENHVVDTVNTIAIVTLENHATGASSAPIVKLSPYVSITNIADTETNRATIQDISDNVIRKSGKLLEYRDPEKTVDKYVDFLKQELYSTYPKDSVADERKIARRLREFYKTKGNEESYRFLFKMLFDEEIELKFPGEDLLRVSDGKFEKTNILRIEATPTVFNFLNRTVVGANSVALGTVVDIRKIIVSETEIAQAELGIVIGTFEAGESIFDVTNSELSANLYGIVSGFQIVDGGSGYEVGDEIIISGDGSDASAKVSSIRRSPVYKLKINKKGYGYREGVVATVDNTATGGEGLIVGVGDIANTYVVEEPAGTFYEVGEISEIFILDRGSGYAKKPTITLIDPIIEPLGMLHTDLITIDNGGGGYAIGDALTFAGGAAPTTAAVGQVASVTGSNNIIFEDSTNILFDNSYLRTDFRIFFQQYPLNFYISGLGDIVRWVYYPGIIPTYRVIGLNERDVLKEEGTLPTGAIVRIELTNDGRGYDHEDLPTIGVTSSGGAGAAFTLEGIQGRSANVEVDTANVEPKYGIGSIRDVEILNYGLDYSTATADLTGSGDGNANLIPIVTGSGTSKGFFRNDDGKVDYKVIQDSEYWQDFSYVIKSGLVIERYSDIVKEILHPAGTVFFGEILIYNVISVTPKFTGIVDVINAIENYFIYITSLVQTLTGSDPQKIEKEIPLEALDPAPLVNDNNIDPVVIIEKSIDVTGQEHTSEYVIDISLDVDTITNSDPQKIEKEILLEALDPAPLVNDNNIDPVVIIEKLTDASGNERTPEYELNLEIPIDVTGQEHTEYELNLEIPVDVAIEKHTEYNIEYQTYGDVSAVGPDQQSLEKEIQINIDAITEKAAEYIVVTEIDVVNSEVTVPQGPITSTYGRQQIIVFAVDQISSIQDRTFDTEYLTTVDIWRRITGTVNVLSYPLSSVSNIVFGTGGTTFLSEFIEDSPITIENEKFLVKSVANNEYMELKVPAQTNYVNVYAYR